jgi:hypothetical protein
MVTTAGKGCKRLAQPLSPNAQARATAIAIYAAFSDGLPQSMLAHATKGQVERLYNRENEHAKHARMLAQEWASELLRDAPSAWELIGKVTIKQAA